MSLVLEPNPEEYDGFKVGNYNTNLSLPAADKLCQAKTTNVTSSGSFNADSVPMCGLKNNSMQDVELEVCVPLDFGDWLTRKGATCDELPNCVNKTVTKLPPGWLTWEWGGRRNEMTCMTTSLSAGEAKNIDEIDGTSHVLRRGATGLFCPDDYIITPTAMQVETAPDATYDIGILDDFTSRITQAAFLKVGSTVLSNFPVLSDSSKWTCPAGNGKYDVCAYAAKLPSFVGFVEAVKNDDQEAAREYASNVTDEELAQLKELPAGSLVGTGIKAALNTLTQLGNSSLIVGNNANCHSATADMIVSVTSASEKAYNTFMENRQLAHDIASSIRETFNI